MQTFEQRAEPNLFEVILYFEGQFLVIFDFRACLDHAGSA